MSDLKINTPIPHLVYSYLRRPGDGVHGEDGPPLYYVSEVTAWVSRQEGLTVWARGRMLCKDGHAGPSRSLRVDRFRREQPDWLGDIIDDAIYRLAAHQEDQ